MIIISSPSVGHTSMNLYNRKPTFICHQNVFFLMLLYFEWSFASWEPETNCSSATYSLSEFLMIYCCSREATLGCFATSWPQFSGSRWQIQSFVPCFGYEAEAS